MTLEERKKELINKEIVEDFKEKTKEQKEEVLSSEPKAVRKTKWKEWKKGKKAPTKKVDKEDLKKQFFPNFDNPEDLLDIVSPYAEEEEEELKGVELTWDIAEVREISCDPDLIANGFLNLISAEDITKLFKTDARISSLFGEYFLKGVVGGNLIVKTLESKIEKYDLIQIYNEEFLRGLREKGMGKVAEILEAHAIKYEVRAFREDGDVNFSGHPTETQKKDDDELWRIFKEKLKLVKGYYVIKTDEFPNYKVYYVPKQVVIIWLYYDIIGIRGEITGKKFMELAGLSDW